MAKILFVSEKIHTHSWGLAQSLFETQNEILFLTSKGQQPPENLRQGFQVLNFFSQWSSIEALRFLPLFWQSQIDAIYFFLDSDHLNSAQSLLFRMSQLFPNIVLSTTTMNLSSGLEKKSNFRRLVQRSDLVTTPTATMLSKLRGLNASKNQIRGLIPPLVQIQHWTEKNKSEKVLKIVEITQEKKIILIPIQLKNFDVEDLNPLSEVQNAFFIFYGSFENLPTARRKKIHAEISEKLGSYWTLSGELNVTELQELVQISSFLFLSGLDLNPVELAHFFQLALASPTVVILDEGQLELYPPVWTPGENALILPQNRFQIRADEVASQIKAFHSPSRPLQDKNRALIQKLTDSPSNEIRRLFNKALSMKSSS